MRMVRHRSSWDTSHLLREMIWELYVVNDCLLYERQWGGLESGYAALTILVIDLYNEMIFGR